MKTKYQNFLSCGNALFSNTGKLLLKGKFSSGIEDALASTLNHFKLETTIRNYSLYFSFDVFKVYLSNIDSETAEI